MKNNENKVIIWQPQPRQAEFMSRPENEALYGGAAGGGKSDALLVEALRQVHIPHYKGLILRKTFPQLGELISRSLDIYPQAVRGAKYNDSKHVWHFPSGAEIHFRSLQHNKDKHNFQGLAFDFIGFDELTHFTFDEYMYLFSRNRPTGAGTRVYIRATANPGGVGHAWVKERFIMAAPPMQTVKEQLKVKDLDGKIRTLSRSRVFVPSTVFDNKALLSNDPNYLANLAMLPEAEKQALLYGNWDSFSGQVFAEWKNDPAHYFDRKYTHVIDPFPIPPHWKIYRGFDFGYAKPFSVGWYAVDEEGKMYRIKEFYGCTNTPNEGVKYNVSEIAEQIKEIEDSTPDLKGKRITGIADPSIWDSSRGESIAEMFERYRVYWDKGDNKRLAGKMQFHYRLAFDNNGECMFQVFNTCKHFIRTVPALCYSEKNVEDVDTAAEDHIYDECRYVFMSRPIKARGIINTPETDPEDPFTITNSYGDFYGYTM